MNRPPARSRSGLEEGNHLTSKGKSKWLLTMHGVSHSDRFSPFLIASRVMSREIEEVWTSYMLKATASATRCAFAIA